MKFWTDQEDQILMRLFNQTPTFRKWKNITVELKKLGIQKTQYECRERYINKLDPEVSANQWTQEEIHQIFKYYDDYGSQWSVIQRLMPGRTQNGIKNKFYGTLRNIIRTIFRCDRALSGSFLHNLSSTKLMDIYEGRKEFKKLKGFLKKALKSLNYDVSRNGVREIIEKNSQMVEELGSCIFKKNKDEKKKNLKKPPILGFKKYEPEILQEERQDSESAKTEKIEQKEQRFMSEQKKKQAEKINKNQTICPINSRQENRSIGFRQYIGSPLSSPSAIQENSLTTPQKDYDLPKTTNYLLPFHQMFSLKGNFCFFSYPMQHLFKKQ